MSRTVPKTDTWSRLNQLERRLASLERGGSGGGGGAVSSVFTRTGAVTATSGDYTVSQVTGAAALASPTFTGTPAAPTATAGTNTTQLATTAFVTAAVAAGAAPPGGLGAYGDGSDGTLTFDGTSVVLGMTPLSSIYTLTRDIFLASGSTINTGVTIIPNGYRVFCTAPLGLVNNGSIQWNGNPGGNGTTVAGTGGLAVGNASGTIIAGAGVSRGGGAGSLTTGVAPATLTLPSYGGAGGHGAAGSSAGGAGGAVTAQAVSSPSPRFLPNALNGNWFNGLDVASGIGGGGGGGGGGGDGTNAGGGGGGGAGIVIVAAYKITGTGTISANGGHGGNGNTTGNTGGGGGGGGGHVSVISSSVSGGAIPGQTITASGGAVGTSHGSGGASGAAGSAGFVALIPN